MALDKNAVKKEAQKFTAKGQYDKAIAEWKKLVRETPNDANLWNTIGDLCLKKEAKAEAVDAYKKAADILASDGFTSKAIALYKKILNIDPKKVEVHLALGDLNAEKGLTGNALESYKLAADFYMQKNEMAKALGIYQKMADLNPANVAFRIKLADMYAKEGLKQEAAKAYLQAADIHIEKQAFQDARHLLEKVLALDAYNKEVYYKAGVVYYKEGKFVEACKAFKPAFEANPANEELATLYLDSLQQTGKEAEAEEVLRTLLGQDSERVDLREKLFRLALAKKEYDKALAEADAIVHHHVNNREYDAAEVFLKAVVTENPALAAARRKLAEYYGNTRREEDAARELIKTAEMLSQGGDRDGAKDALGRALDFVPGMPEARQLLERLEAPSEGPAPAMGAPLDEAAAAEPAAMSLEQPEPSPVLEMPAEEIPVQPQALEAEEDPAVAEAFTEVDVLTKYGLANKALEQLENLTGRFPSSPRVRTRLRDLYREQGNVKKAAEHALALADLYVQAGMQAQAEAVLLEALEFDPGNAAIQSRLGMAAAPAAPEPDFTEPSLPEPAIPGSVQPFADVPLETPAPEQEASGTWPGLPSPEGLEALNFTPPSEPGYGAPAPAQASQTLEETLKEDWIPPAPGGIGIQEPAEAPAEPKPAQGPLESAVDLSELWAEAEFYFQQGLFDEAKKHYENILEHAPGDARARGRIAEITRQAEEAQAFSTLSEAMEGLEGLIPSGAPASSAEEPSVSTSDEEAVRTLMQEIQTLRRQQASPPTSEEAAPPVSPAEPAESGPDSGVHAEPPAQTEGPAEREEIDFGDFDGARSRGTSKEDFFDLGEELRSSEFAAALRPSPARESGGDFFDLAAELREELGGVTLAKKPGAPAEEQSLDDLFEEFKKGIEDQGGKEEGDTHYNLGIAYKEMGLLDEAIVEFLMTHEGEPKFVQSRYMLGLCYMQQGEYHKAIAEIGNAINFSQIFSVDASETLGMHYDLALAYQGMGNMDVATREFQRAFDLDPGYRDVAAKLQELQKGEFISLEQLKEDIEREISTKFLEEGERIEREEKTRKTEKVRGLS